MHYFGTLPHAEAVEIVRRCDVLLVLMYETDYSFAIVPHKLYEYLTLETPIMAVAEKRGEVASIIRRTGTGTVVSVKDGTEIRDHLLALCKDLNGYRRSCYRPITTEICKYEVSSLVGRLADIMTQLTGSRNLNDAV